MKWVLSILFGIIFTFSAMAQILEAYFNFDQTDCSTDLLLTDGNSGNGLAQGSPECGCGVSGSSLKLDGVDDYALLLGNVRESFGTADFSMSFYIKPTFPSGNQVIFSKRENCNFDNAFGIHYIANAHAVSVILAEHDTIKSILDASLSYDKCWHHVVFSRSGSRSQLYINGELKDQAQASQRVRLDNSGTPTIGGNSAPGNLSDCIGTIYSSFKGYIDEFRVYSDPLTPTQVEALYLHPDEISTTTNPISIGESLDIEITNTCATSFSWSPSNNVADPTVAETSIVPDAAGTFVYDLAFNDAECRGEKSLDSIKIIVTDPSTLPCIAYLPSAFTPNNDGTNDIYEISNPPTLENKMTSFEIFDRWGNRVFYTTNPYDGWDGTYKGSKVNPGVFLYRVVYDCNNQKDKLAVGSLTVLR